MNSIPDRPRTDAAARFVGLAPSTMAKMRVRGDGPPFSKAGARVVVYDIADLEEWAPGDAPEVDPVPAVSCKSVT